MLVTLNYIFENYNIKNSAIAGFNVYGYEDAYPIVKAAEKMNLPVILMVNKDAVAYMGVKHIAAILKEIAKHSKIPICIHLDHAKEKKVIMEAIDCGFTSVMYDGSALELDENIENTQKIVALAHDKGISVEAEIGSVGYNNDLDDMNTRYTDPMEAKVFWEKTKVDALAVSIGTLHRMEEQSANIQYGRLLEIQKNIGVPLVLHGSTGVADEDLKKLATQYNIGKVNIGTAIRMAFGKSLRAEMLKNESEFDRTKLFELPMKAVEKMAVTKMNLLK